MVSADPEHAWRRLRMAAEYRECNTDRSKWPPGDVAACNFSLSYTVAGIVYLGGTRMCWNPACLRLLALMKADNPVECATAKNNGDLQYPYVFLYADILTPLEKACSQLSSPRTVDPISPPVDSPSAEASMTPTSPAKTTQPSTSASKTRAPSTSRPASAGTADNSDSTLVPSDTSPAASTTSSSTTPSPQAPQPSLESSPISPSLSSSSSSSSAASSSSQSSDENQSVFDNGVITRSPEGTVLDSNVGTSSASRSSRLVAGIIVGLALLLAVLFIIFIKRTSRRKAKQSAAKLDPSMTNTTAETSMLTQEDRSNVDSQLMALENWRIDSSELVDGRILGCGAQRALYLVTLDGRRRLASKRLIRDQLTSQRLNSVVAEIELVATLVHPSIVEFVGVAWTTPSDLQILFEYMPNGDLRTHLDQTKPSQHQPKPWTTEKLKHTIQIAQALVYVHSFNPPVVHRDIKARNVLLDDEMNAKLSDFGVSRSLSEQATMTTGIGTSRWLAPEVIMGGGKYTEQCDIYSFGVLLVEMDSHEIPFADEKLPEIELLHRVATGTLRPTLSAACDPLLRELILQCLSADPSARPNALELSYRLRKILKTSVTD